MSGNAGRNHKEIPLHTHWDGEKLKKGTSVGEDEEKLKPPCIAVGNVNCGNRYGQQVGGLKKLNTESPHDPEISRLGIYSRELSRYSNKNMYTSVHSSINHNSQKMETTQVSMNG